MQRMDHASSEAWQWTCASFIFLIFHICEFLTLLFASCEFHLFDFKCHPRRWVLANFKASSIPRAEQASKEWIVHEYLPHGSPFYFCYSKINLKHSPSLTALAPKLNYFSDPIHYLTHWLYIWSHFALFFPSVFCSTSIELILFPGIHTVSCLYGCTHDIFFPRMAYSLFLV